MKIFGIIQSQNYADEFNYPVISFFTEEMKLALLLHGMVRLEDNDFGEMYFGSNEALDFSKGEISRMIQNAPEIDPDEYKIIKKHCSKIPRLDIVDSCIDMLWDRIDELNEPEIVSVLEAATKSQQEFI